MKFLALIAGLGAVLFLVLLIRATETTNQLLFGGIAALLVVLCIGSLVAGARREK